MRTTIDIPVPLLEAAQREASIRDVTLSVVVEDALREHLANKAEVKSGPFVLHTVRGRLVDPAIDLDRTSALLLADDEAEYRG